MDRSAPRPDPHSREALHAAVAAVAARAGLHPDLRDALGFYGSARRQFDRAAEHVLALAAYHPPPLDAAERET